MTQNPTNTDLAAALREIADTLPLGPQLIVRLAADRLGAHGDPEVLGEHDPDRDPWDPHGEGWVKWDPYCGKDCPVEAGTEVSVKFDDGEIETDDTPEYWNWANCGRNITAYRIVK